MENYQKIRVVGRGAYGTVYLVRRLADNKELIIKEIPVEQMTREERQAALNEVKVLSMLDHPNIIQYIENFLEDKALMIVMEYAEGGTLFEFLQQRSGQLLDEETILCLFVQMLLSLQHVHSKQILHRDLKTQNILLNKRREVLKIGDFGISKVLSSKSKAYTVVGTPCYISPELCEGKPYNQKSDIWALGCVLYELTTLKKAFEAQNLPALILKIMRGTFSPISAQYSAALGELLLSMLHLDPARRPSINQILARPIVLNALIRLYTDVGRIPCRSSRMLGSLSSLGPRGAQSRMARHNQLLGKGDVVYEEHGGVEGTGCSVWGWGGGITVPARLPLPTSDTIVTQVAVGRTQKAAVTKNGRLFVWEAPSVSGDAVLPGALEHPMLVPRYLEGQSAVTIRHVACGDLFTACLTDRGILMTFGSGASGCLGHGNLKDVAQAKIVERLLGFEIEEVSCGSAHVMAVTNDSEVFAWGRGDAGRLGLGEQEATCTPQQVDIPAPHRPARVRCGLDCSMIISSHGHLLCCGSNRSNKLGLDIAGGEPVEEMHTLTMVRSLPLPNMQVKDVAMGTSHSAILTESNEVLTFGSNQFGQLGVGTADGERRVERLKGLGHVTHISCGDTFTAIANSAGEIRTWGKPARGRLGRVSDVPAQPGPVTLKEEGAVQVAALSCSHGSTLVVTNSSGIGEHSI